MPVEVMSARKNVAVSFLQLVASGRVREAFEKYVGPGFRHHNPHFDATPEALIHAMEENARQFPQKHLDVKRALEDGDLVAVHSHVRHTPDERGYGLVHIFRFDGDRVAELWDLAQEVPANSPNGNGMF